MPVFTRAIVIVLDSVGIGALPDASGYGDEGSDTIGNIARRIPLQLPTLRSLGLGRVASIGGPPPPPPSPEDADADAGVEHRRGPRHR